MPRTIFQATIDTCRYYFNRWFGKPPPEERPIPNPLKVKVGSTIHLPNDLNLDKYDFKVQSLREVTRTEEKRKHTFIDYDLSGRSLELEVDKEQPLRIRVFPDIAMVLWPVDEQPNSPELLSVFDGRTDEFTRILPVEDETQENPTEVYYREATRSGRPLLTAYKAEVRTEELQDKVTKITPSSMQYKNYSRNTKSVSGREFRQYFFVEQDLDTGVFTFWQGEKLLLENVY